MDAIGIARQIATLAALTVLAACRAANEPTVQYQFCTDVHRTRGEIKNTLVELSLRNNMQFLDRSAEAERESRLLDKKGRKIGQSYPLLMMTIWKKSGPSLTVTNAGLPANQLVLGITRGSQEDSRKFVSDAVQEFSNRWKLVMVPSGSGARPLTECGQ